MIAKQVANLKMFRFIAHMTSRKQVNFIKISQSFGYLLTTPLLTQHQVPPSCVFSLPKPTYWRISVQYGRSKSKSGQGKAVLQLQAPATPEHKSNMHSCPAVSNHPTGNTSETMLFWGSCTSHHLATCYLFCLFPLAIFSGSLLHSCTPLHQPIENHWATHQTDIH